MSGARVGTALLMGLGALATACNGEPPERATQIIVSIDSDLERADLRAVRVDVLDPEDERVVGTRSYDVAGAAPSAGSVTLPFSFAIDRAHRDAVRVVVTALGGAAAAGARVPLAEHKVDARFVAHEALLLRVFLARNCLGQLCDARTTCTLAPDGEASCMPIARAALSPLTPGTENQWPRRDAGPDADGASAAEGEPAHDGGAVVDSDVGEPPSDAGAPVDGGVDDAGAEKNDASEAPNLLQNPSFEEVDDMGRPRHWKRTAWKTGADACPPSIVPTSDDDALSCWMQVRVDTASGGLRSVSMTIPADTPNDARWAQDVTGLVPGRSYRLCGKLQGNVGPTGTGASLFFEAASVWPLVAWQATGTLPAWPATPYCGTVVANAEKAEVGCRMGLYAQATFGTLGCDELSLRALPELDPGTE